LARTLVGSFLGLLEAIGFALDGEHLGVVDQAVDQGDDAGGIWKDLASCNWKTGTTERPCGWVPKLRTGSGSRASSSLVLSGAVLPAMGDRIGGHLIPAIRARRRCGVAVGHFRTVFRFLTVLVLQSWREEAMSDPYDLFTYVVAAAIISGVAMWFSLRARNHR
jgi:hypothetical protein